jgi:hypothetical protein
MYCLEIRNNNGHHAEPLALEELAQSIIPIVMLLKMHFTIKVI